MENMAANAAGAAEEVVTSSAPAEGSVAATEPSEQSPAAPQSEVTETQAFARRLAEKSRVEADRQIAAVGLVNTYTGEPIMNSRDLQAFKRMSDADAAGEDPRHAAEIADMQSRIADYELRDQEAAIMANPALSPWYEEYREDIASILDMARAGGSQLSVEAALRAVMAQNMDAIMERQAASAREEVTKQFQAQAAASPGALGGSAVDNVVDVANMTDAQFEAYKNKVKRGEIKLR